MKLKIKISKSFRKASKPLIKKYDSFASDLKKLEEELEKNPKLGSPIGRNAYKIRLRIESKNKGKSGGARVISYLEIVGILEEEKQTNVTLIMIYDKSEREAISDSELKFLIENIEI